MNIDYEIFDLDQIEESMRSFWPSKKIAHREIAIKYYTLCKQAITRGIKMADPEAVKFNLIPVGFKQIRDQLGRYGPRGQEKYWFDWFQENHALMQPVIRGTNFGRNKRGSLTMIKTTNTIARMLALNTSQEIFDSYYAGIDPNELDYVAIDLDSLTAYIEHNRDTQKYNSSNKQHLAKLKENEQQALLILTLAHYNQGLLPQHRSQSKFGRCYYQGPNLQSSAKIIRHAALGACYQYDIEASVFTWKFDLTKELDALIKLPATLEYLDQKNYHRARLSQLIFENKTEYSINTIKRVITAVGFGARVTNAVGWYENGQWVTTAIRDIIRSNLLIKKLFNDPWFKEFVNEQDLMSQTIFNLVKDQVKHLEFLQNTSGRLSKNKTISYCYQQTEAKIISALEQRLKEQNNHMLLLCHDGFYTKKRADLTDLRYELQQFLKHGRLEEIQHTEFKYQPDSVIEEQEHLKRIRFEEQQVSELFNKPLHRPLRLTSYKNTRNEDFDSGYDDGSKAYQEPNTYVYQDQEYEIEQHPDYIQELIYARNY